MDINLLMILSGITVIILIWAFLINYQLKFYKRRIVEQWENLDENLRKRHNLVPNLVETVRIFASGQEEMLKSLINIRSLAAKKYEPDGKKIEFEHDLTKVINRVIDFGRSYKDLSLDTNFLELRKEIEDTEGDTQKKVQIYNEMVRKYNKSLESLWFFWGKMFGFKPKNVFEFEI